MELFGYFASILIGFSLGLLGGGGSILTVPVLFYLFQIDAVLATAYSLFIVGSTSLVGSLSYFRRNQIELATVTAFGLPSVIAVFLTRRFVVPAIPEVLFRLDNFVLTKGLLLLLLFAILMIVASYSMIKGRRVEENAPKVGTYVLILQGVFIGMVTALVGAGGGFLIIPVLVNLLHLPMKTAIGTSLAIIAINSLLGFLFSLPFIAVSWFQLITITGIAILGIYLGSFVSTKIDGKKLKPAFGWFVLIMGVYIIITETILL